MPVPQELLRSAIGTLPESTVAKMAKHCGVSTVGLSRAQIIEKLASDDGLRLCSYSHHMSEVELRQIAAVFGVDSQNPGPGGVGFAVWKFVNDYDKNRQRDAFHENLGVPKLAGGELRDAVQEMVRPCVHLTTNPADGPLAGIWRGPGVLSTEIGGHEHRITIDCSCLPAEFESLQLAGAAGVYVNRDDVQTGEFDGRGGRVVIDPTCRVRSLPDSLIEVGARRLMPGKDCGIPLYAKPGTSYPSAFQVIESPPESIREWLRRMKFGFEPGDYSSLPAKELRDCYRRP